LEQDVAEGSEVEALASVLKKLFERLRDGVGQNEMNVFCLTIILD
jgi:hypothetical protein